MKYAGIARRCIRTTAAVLLAAAAAAPATAADCVRLPAAPRAPIPAVTLTGLDLDRKMTLCELLALVGPPMWAGGSGSWILSWDIDDGRELVASGHTATEDGNGNQLIWPYFIGPSLWKSILTPPALHKPVSQYKPASQ